MGGSSSQKWSGWANKGDRAEPSAWRNEPGGPADPTRAYLAHNREVILLAAGELGVLRADDARLDRLVETW